MIFHILIYIAKTMTSNGKQFFVTREMLAGVVMSEHEEVIYFHWLDPFVLLYSKSLNEWSQGEQ